MKLFDRVERGENFFEQMDKREAQVVKEQEEEEIEVKSYDSEDSLDKLEFQSAPAAEVVNSEEKKEIQDKAKVDAFLDDLVSGNIKGETENSFIKVKYDIFKLINKNEHLFIKYAEKKLVENKTYIIDRAQKLKKATNKETITTQRVLAGPTLMQTISNELEILKNKTNTVATSCVVTDEVVLIGTSAGVLWAFERES